jgi:formate/nitrite transporter
MMDLRRRVMLLAVLAASTSDVAAFVPARVAPVTVNAMKSTRTFGPWTDEAVASSAKVIDAAKGEKPHMPPLPPREYTMLETPADAFQLLADKGRANGEASKMKIFVSSMLGGAYVGMGGMLSLAVSGNLPGISASNPGLAKMIFAALFPVNLLLCLQAGGQLFTGNTAYMTAALCEGKTTVKKLLRVWGISFIGNWLACGLFAIGCKYSGVLSGGAGELAVSTLIAKTTPGLGPLFVKAIFCNWLVCLAVYLSFQAKDMSGKYMSIFLPISTFVAIGFEHSVANMFLLPAGIMCQDSISVATAVFKNLIPVSIGNALSGSILVGAMFSYLFGSLGNSKK